MAYKNKEDQKKSARRHYLKNRDKMLARSQKYNEEKRAQAKKIIKEHLLSHPCVDCGISDIRVLQFDHVRGVKKYNISNLMRDRNCLSALREEIEKCDIRCANCHQIRSFYGRATYRSI